MIKWLSRVYCNGLELSFDLPRQILEFNDPLDLIAKKSDPVAQLLLICRDNIQAVAPDPERSWAQFQIVPLIMPFHQLAQQRIAAVDVSTLKIDHHPPIIFGIADPIDAGD